MMHCSPDSGPVAVWKTGEFKWFFHKCMRHNVVETVWLPSTASIRFPNKLPVFPCSPNNMCVIRWSIMSIRKLGLPTSSLVIIIQLNSRLKQTALFSSPAFAAQFAFVYSKPETVANLSAATVLPFLAPLPTFIEAFTWKAFKGSQTAIDTIRQSFSEPLFSSQSFQADKVVFRSKYVPSSEDSYPTPNQLFFALLEKKRKRSFNKAWWQLSNLWVNFLFVYRIFLLENGECGPAKETYCYPKEM